LSFWGAFGEEDTISRNKETISNPAITAPTNICDPISSDQQSLFLKHAIYHIGHTVRSRDPDQVSFYSLD